MKTKTLFFLILLLSTTFANSQSFKFGTVAADAGVGLRFYGVRAYSPVNKTDVIGIFLGSGLPTVNAEFRVLKFLGVGAKYSRGVYAQQGFKVRTNDYSVCVNIHVANKKDKFDLPISLCYGFSKFNADQNNSTTPQFIHINGGVVNLSVAPHFYFGKYIGMFIRLGYNKYLYNNIVMDNGTESWTQADGATWKMGGIDFTIGIAGRFDVLKKNGTPSQK